MYIYIYIYIYISIENCKYLPQVEVIITAVTNSFNNLKY